MAASKLCSGARSLALSAGMGLAVSVICSIALGATDRPVHRYLETAPSPDGIFIADVEGDAPPSGREPMLRDLVIRRIDTGAAVTVQMPCGRVSECWPSSLVWTRDASQLSFALRLPGSHARSIYTIAADGSHLTQLLAFDGTINSLRYGSDGRLAMLATEGANKEVGATQAGSSIADAQVIPNHEQRIGILENQHLTWASPPELFVYEYDWLPDAHGFVGTAAPGNGDNNWWIAKLYEFDTPSASSRVLYAPTDSRQQIAEPRVSSDGKTVAFIGGLMSDFGSTGGDVYLLPMAGGAAVNATKGQHASATSLGFDCHGTLLVKLLRGDESEVVQMNIATPASSLPKIWSGSATIAGSTAGISLGCPSSLTSTVKEDFTTAPEILAGPIGHWNALSNSNAGMTVAAQVQSIHWNDGGFDLQGWLVLPDSTTSGTTSRKMPLITIVHGGPAAASVPIYIGPGVNRALLGQGYALFLPNPRGSFG